MAALKTFDEHHETSHHTCSIKHIRRREADGTVKVEYLIEEVETRTNVKYLAMNHIEAGKQSQNDVETFSKVKSFKSKDPPRHADNGSFRSLNSRWTAKHGVLELPSENNILDDECPESDQDWGGHDLIDLIDSPRSQCEHEWVKNGKSPLWGLNGRSSPVMSNVVLLSDGDESNTARSDTMSELVLDSESDDDGHPVNLSMSQYSGPNVSPELSTTPLSFTLSLSNSQGPLSALNCRDSEDGGNVSDDSHCSIASGPSKPSQPVAQGPCNHCLRLCMRVKSQPHWTKSLVKDPACLYYDQWWLQKPWRRQGVCCPRRMKGKLFEHLPLIWQRAKAQAEGDLQDECEVCTRPHVFLQRNLRQCKRPRSKSLSQTRAKNRTVSRRRRRSNNLWPPIGSRQARKRKSKSMENSIKEEKKKSVKERQGRRGRPKREETDRHHELQDEEPLTFDLTADSSTEGHASVSPRRHQDMNSDMEIIESPDKRSLYSHKQTDAKEGSQRHRHTDYVCCSPDEGEDSLVDLGTDGHVDEHTERLSSSPHSVLPADGQSGIKAFQSGVRAGRDESRSAVRQPVIRLFRCNSVNGDASTERQADELRQSGHKPTKVKLKGHSRPQRTERHTDSGVDVDLSGNADEQGRCLSNVERQTKSPSEGAFNGPLDGDPYIHSKGPSGVKEGKMVVGPNRHVARREEGDSDLSAGVAQACRALSFEEVKKKPRPTSSLIASNAPLVMASGSAEVGAEVSPHKDSYVFRTPTPPGTQSLELIRKLRPFARTYESKGTEAEGLKSMLRSLKKTHPRVVCETDP